MIPLRARWARWAVRVRCLVGTHEDVLAADPTRLAYRCLHCRRETVGWVPGVPRYTRTHEADLTRLVLHNPRLRDCPCAACETRRHDRQQRVVKIRGG